MVEEKITFSLFNEDEARTLKQCSEADKQLLYSMINEISDSIGKKIRFLSELDYYCIPGSGRVILKYIDRYSSETIRSYLINQLINDRVSNCAEILLQLYKHFKQSCDYISEKGKPAPAHITVRYDNAFKQLKPKRAKNELLSLACNPRDAFYLPLTMRMLASWRLPDLECVFVSYLEGAVITYQSVGLPEQSEDYYPSFSFIKRELKFTAIDSLKYYPSKKTIGLLRNCINDSDKDICFAAQKAMKFLTKHYL